MLRNMMGAPQHATCSVYSVKSGGSLKLYGEDSIKVELSNSITMYCAIGNIVVIMVVIFL